jgi:hypothetical protein
MGSELRGDPVLMFLKRRGIHPVPSIFLDEVVLTHALPEAKPILAQVLVVSGIER